MQSSHHDPSIAVYGKYRNGSAECLQKFRNNGGDSVILETGINIVLGGAIIYTKTVNASMRCGVRGTCTSGGRGSSRLVVVEGDHGSSGDIFYPLFDAVLAWND